MYEKVRYFTSRQLGGITQEKDLNHRLIFDFIYPEIYTIQKLANFIGASPKDLNSIFQVVNIYISYIKALSVFLFIDDKPFYLLEKYVEKKDHTENIIPPLRGY